MDAQTKRVRQTYIGDTLYIVESLQSDTATETAYNKIKRLILSNANAPKKLSETTQLSSKIDSTSLK
ncbi:Transposon-encoded protein TnpW [anaerobic digester metagenome]|jgi:hypothetical protein